MSRLTYDVIALSSHATNFQNSVAAIEPPVKYMLCIYKNVQTVQNLNWNRIEMKCELKGHFSNDAELDGGNPGPKGLRLAALKPMTLRSTAAFCLTSWNYVPISKVFFS